MGKPTFYSLDFSRSLNQLVRRWSASIWFGIVIIAICFWQYISWFRSECKKPTVADRLPTLDELGAPIVELRDGWVEAKKKYDPLLPIVAAQDEAAVAAILSHFDPLMADLAEMDKAMGVVYGPALKCRRLVIERGRSAKLEFDLLLPRNDKVASVAAGEAFITNRIGMVTFPDPSDTNKTIAAAVSLAIEGRDSIGPETTSLEGRLSFALPVPPVLPSVFPPVDDSVAKAAEIVEKWQKRVEDYKFKPHIAWYRKLWNKVRLRSDPVSQEVDFAMVKGFGKDNVGFLRLVRTHIDPLRLAESLVNVSDDDVEAKKTANRIKDPVNRFVKAWNGMVEERNPYRRERIFDNPELDSDIARIGAVSTNARPMIAKVVEIGEKTDRQVEGLSKGLKAKHFQEDTFRERVIDPPFASALPDGFSARLEGSPGVRNQDGQNQKKNKKKDEAESDILAYPEWNVSGGAPSSKGEYLSTAEFKAVRQALFNVESSVALPWVVRLEVDFANAGQSDDGWPVVGSFRMTGRVPCWLGD